jgi:hypothetical protein
MGSICDEVTDRMYNEMPDYSPKRCKHGYEIDRGCHFCKLEKRIEHIEKTLGIDNG